ncbi:MAG: glycosyltransferase family 2 protein [Nanoarchaeota archaeon]|nr:glycosyltransferase family 2 protein [Nanoarchaeota archaeon]
MKDKKYTQSISVFIPAYNEEENIREVSLDIIKFLNKHFKTYELILVINKCKDKTPQLAKELAKKNKHIRVIQQKTFVGYGSQLKKGWENAKYDLVFYTDSDRQFNIEELTRFMESIKEYDAVVGYRKKRRDPFMRIAYSKLYNLALGLILGIKFKDADCAFKLCKKEVIDAIKPITQDRGADSEFLVKATAKGFKMKQLPVTHRPRIAGVSEAESEGGGFFVKIKPEIIKALIKETLYLRKFRNPENF